MLSFGLFAFEIGKDWGTICPTSRDLVKKINLLVWKLNSCVYDELINIVNIMYDGLVGAENTFMDERPVGLKNR